MTAAEATPPMEDRLAGAQHETQRLRDMVTALFIEVAALKAAANPVWEGHGDTGEGADEAAHAEMDPARRARFTDSQGEWQAPEVAEEADEQDRHFIGSPSAGDRRGHDPWMPATSRYPVPSWDYSEPPQTPPGMATTAASEQWTERADAQNEWWPKGDSGWWTQWQDGAGWNQSGYNDWGWPTQHHSWNDRNSSRGNSWGPRHSLDRKDIAKPECYSGDITK